MAHVLVVEDSPEQAHLIAAVLASAGFDVAVAASGEQAIRLMAERTPDLVVTDLIMPGMDGLEVVEAVHEGYPRVPVILMTAFGSGEIAARALKSGAASYVPKRRLHDELVPTVRDTLAVAAAQRERVRMLASLDESEYRFTLDNDPELVPPLVSYVQDEIRRRSERLDETELMQIGIALHEALINAIHHGNLEVGSELREGDLEGYHKLIERRKSDLPFRDRRVRVSVQLSSEELVCVIQDEGPGFDPSKVPDPTDPENLERVSGRGLYLIWTFMDRVTHNATGNEVTLVKRLAQSGLAA